MGLSNSQHNRIMSGYSARILYHENELNEHKTIAYRVCPRIRDIEDEVASLSAAQAIKRIRGNNDGQLEYTQQMTALAAEKANLLETYEFPADYLQMKYDCDICKDTGIDGSKRCKCYMIAATQLLYKSSGLTNVLELENFDNFNLEYYPDDFIKTIGGHDISARDNMTNVLSKCKAYVDKFGDDKPNLLFSGQAGCGKTFMTHCIAKALMDKGFSVVYQSAGQFFDNLASQKFGTSDDPESAGIALFFTEADLLIIDDLGTEVSNSFTNSRLFDCINARLMKGLATIISTNESFSEIRDAYSDRVYSRIIGNYVPMLFFGPDIRKQKSRKSI